MKNKNKGQPPIRKVKGMNGAILMYDDRVVVHHKGVVGLATQGIKGETTLFYSNISAIDYKKPGLVHGYIRFVVPGTVVANSKARIGWGTDPMRRDPNAVLFTTYHNKKHVLDQLCAELTERINPSKQQPVQGASAADELMKLSGLLAQGAITQEEFAAAKKQLLGL